MFFGSTFACAVVVGMAHLPARVSAVLLILMVCVAGGLALFDVRERRLPNVVVYPLFVVVVIAVAGAGLESGELGRAFVAIGVSVLAAGVLAVGARAIPLGMGDVKLAASIAVVLLWFGLIPAAVGFAGAAIVAGAVGLVTLRHRASNSASLVPLGPALAAGLVVGLVAAGIGL